MTYEVMVRKYREAEEEYIKKGKVEKLQEYLMYESIDGDDVPDNIEEMDFNKNTTWYRFNYPDEVSMVERKRRRNLVR